VVVNEKTYKESSFIEPGSTSVSIQTPWFKLGLSICYDVRFPELYRSRAFDGVDLIVVPAAFTIETGAVHWETLLTSRAIENLSYVLAAAQWGEHYGDRKTYGHSMIINPWGETVNALPSGNGVVIAEIDLELIAEIRENFPALLHRKILPDS
jgi:nitrilase